MPPKSKRQPEPPREVDPAFEDQDDSHLLPPAPKQTTIMGLRCVVADVGRTDLIVAATTEPTKETLVEFLTEHVKKPDLSKRAQRWGSASLIQFTAGVLTELGFSQDFLRDLGNKKEEREQGAPAAGPPAAG